MTRPRTASLVGAATLAATLLATSAASADTHRVFTSTNEAAGNRVLVYDRAAHGALEPVGSVATGGLGTGGGLSNQGAVQAAGGLLFVADAGSDDVAVLRLGDGSPVVVGRTPSGGQTPISVTVHRSLLYVLNAGQGGTIAGFTIGSGGSLTPIAGSVRAVAGSGPAEIQFSPSGRSLYVTERTSNTIDTFPVDDAGRAGAPVSTASSGATPFGFAVDRRGDLVVSEAAGGPGGTSAVSSYRPSFDGTLTTITASAADHQNAACWIGLSGDERFAYTANAASNTLSGYAVGHDGRLTLLDADGITATTGGHPTDLTAGPGQELFSLAAGTGEIDAFRTGGNGELTRTDTATGVPSSATGIAIG